MSGGRVNELAEKAISIAVGTLRTVLIAALIVLCFGARLDVALFIGAYTGIVYTMLTNDLINEGEC